MEKVLLDKQKKRNESREPTPNKYRVGNVGYLEENGDIWGTCHRQTMVRNMGLQANNEFSLKAAFEAGFANEAYTKEVLPPSTEDYDEIIWEPEWEVSKQVGDILIEGHPDLGFKKDGKMYRGGELKASCSPNSLADPYLTDKPKPSQMIQAALYSYMTDIPFILHCATYTEPAPWLLTQFEKPFMKHRMREYLITIENGDIVYENEWGDKINSGKTIQGVLDYYLLCQELIEKKELYKRPIWAEKSKPTRVPLRKTKAKKKAAIPCDYCHLRTACDKYENNFDRWVEEVKVLEDKKLKKGLRL